MTVKELKRLNRAELLELLLIQTKEMERLQEELAQAREELAERRLKLTEAGNIAAAALAVNGVMEAAQAAAQQYLENMAAMEAETREKCDRMIANAKREAAVLTGRCTEAELLDEIHHILGDEDESDLPGENQ